MTSFSQITGQAFYMTHADTMLARYMLLPCDCLRVCLSVTPRYCIKTAKRRIMQTMLHDIPVILVF